jgi:colicin import membrane protein
MSTGILDIPKSNDGSTADPFRLGWRYVDEPGGESHKVGLSEWDLLHPLEGDFIVNNHPHSLIVTYLFQRLTEFLANQPGTLVLMDHLVNWGVEGLGNHAPDIVVFDCVTGTYDPQKGTFAVEQTDARPRLAVEVTSPATRNNDLGIKVDHYFEAGIPYYLIVDFDNSQLQLIAYRRARNGYVPVPADPANGIWIPTVQLWFRVEGNRVLLFDADGRKVHDTVDLTEKWKHEKQRADQEKQRAEQEKQRAEQEKQRAEQEKQRAEQEKQHAEQEKQRAQHEKQRAEQEKQRAEHEKQRADALQTELAALKARMRSPTDDDNPETDHLAD